MAPTDPLPVVRLDAKAHERSLDVMRWGLLPLWAKDTKSAIRPSTPSARPSRQFCRAADCGVFAMTPFPAPPSAGSVAALIAESLPQG